MQDDNAHAWVLSKPQVSVDDAALRWPVRHGDRVIRLLDQQEYEISAVIPESARRTVFELTARKRVVPSFLPSLDFSDARNSQYVGVI